MLQKIEHDKDYAFLISAEYDFDKRIWISWSLEIESDWWKDSNNTSYQYPILKDHMYFYNNVDLNISLSDRIFKEPFGISLFSSNNLEFFDTLVGYYICQNETDFQFMPSKVDLYKLSYCFESDLMSKFRINKIFGPVNSIHKPIEIFDSA